MNKVLISTHKKYFFPKSEIYFPIHVGVINSLDCIDIAGDDTGINISNKN